MPLSVSALSPSGAEVPPPYVLSCPSPACPPCCPQCHGGTGPCPGTSAAAGPLGTCTPLDGVKVHHTENLLGCPCVVCACWFAVHVSALRVGPSCSSACPEAPRVHFPLLSQLLLLMACFGLRNCSSCFSPAQTCRILALVLGLSMSSGVCASRWGQEQKSHLVLLDVTGHSLHEGGGKSDPSRAVPLPEHKSHMVGIGGCPERWIWRQIFPQIAFTLL